MQLTVLAISLVLMAIVATAFICAVRAADKPVTTDNIDAKRSRLIWGLLIVGAVVTTASLWTWPHAVQASGESITINATGYQWDWEIDKTEVPAGKPIVFNVHAGDVTHGLGIVDPSGRLLFQTQAMPGYVNKIEHVFETAGPHKVICMEFCGIAHHDMVSEFNVVTQ